MRGAGARRNLEFRLLGSFDVAANGRSLELGSRKQRAVLAVLAISANRVVSLDRLIDELWGDQPPAAATGSLQAYISNLRRVLEPDRAPRDPPQVLLTRPPGYLLQIDPVTLDVTRFQALAVEGRLLLTEGRTVDARKRLEQALAEWRGSALADFAFEGFAQHDAARLEELRLAVTEDRIQADIELGDNSIVPEIEALVSAHPLREGLWASLMLALYRSGRQADALRAYQSARKTLCDELGLEPGPRLRQLEDDVLAQASTLDWRPPGQPPPGVATPPVSPPAAPQSDAPVPDASRRLIGRVSELASLEACLARAVDGEAAAVWVAGEAGIGKTRLVEELVTRAQGRGMLTAWGGAVEGGSTPAYWPWVEALRSLLEAPDREALRSALGDDAAELAQVVPEVKELTGPLDAPPALDPDTARLRLFEAFAAFLGRLGSGPGVTVVLDDLQWADVATLQLLSFIGSRLGRTKLLLVGTYRPSEVGPSHPLVNTFAALARRHAGHRVELPGLSEQEVGSLIEVATGTAAASAIVATVSARTGGNPFFVSELAHLMASERDFSQDSAARAVPAGVRDVVRLRLARLPEQTTAVLSLAAVAGRSFALEVVEAAADLDGERTLELVEAALVSGLVSEDSDRIGRFQFTHDLVREAVMEELSTLRRSRLHARLGEALVTLYGDDDRHATELAHHFMAAAPVVGPEPAITYALRAAEVETARLAYEDAENQLRRVLDVIGRMRAGPERDRSQLDALLRLTSLVMMTKGYATPEAAEVLGQAEELCLRLGENRQMVRVLFGLMSVQLVAGRHPAAREVADRLLVVAQRTTQPVEMVAAHLAVGITAFHQGELETSRQHLEAGLAVQDGVGDPWLTGWLPFHPVVGCQTFLAGTMLELGHRTRAKQLVAESLAYASRCGHDLTTAHALHFVAWVAVVDHDAAAALDPLEEALDFAREKRFPFYVALNTCLRGWTRAQRGDADAGVAELTGGLAGLAAGGAGLVRTMFLPLLAESLHLAGRPEEGLDVVERAVELVEITGERFYEAEVHRVRGELLLAVPGRRDEAEAEMCRAAAIAERQGAKAFEARATESKRRLSK